LIPAADIGKLQRPQEIATELLHPIPKTITDLIYNKSMFTESDITRYPGENKQILGVDVPAPLQHIILSTLPISRAIREIDSITRKREKKEPLTRREILIQTLLTSIYKTTPEELREKSLKNIKSDLSELKWGYKQAAKNDRKHEMKRIEQSINELQQAAEDVEQ
jgi:hypothetical protein